MLWNWCGGIVKWCAKVRKINTLNKTLKQNNYIIRGYSICYRGVVLLLWGVVLLLSGSCLIAIGELSYCFGDLYYTFYALPVFIRGRRGRSLRFAADYRRTSRQYRETGGDHRRWWQQFAHGGRLRGVAWLRRQWV